VKRRKPVKKGQSAKRHASASAGKRAQNSMADMSEMYRPIKKPITLRIDADVLAWFKKQGSGYQTRINRALRGLMLEGRKRHGG